MDAICLYALDRSEIELSPIAKAMFGLIKPQLDANNVRYENGKLGGRPKEPKNNLDKTKTKPKDNLDETKAEPNVNGNVNDNENLNDNDVGFALSIGDIKLTQQKLDEWRKIYTTVDVPAYLYQLESSTWYATQLAANRRWEQVCIASLNSQHQKNIAASAQAVTKPKKQVIY